MDKSTDKSFKIQFHISVPNSAKTLTEQLLKSQLQMS